MVEKIVPATTEQIDVLTAFAEENLEGFCVPMKIQTQISIVIDEVFNNIASYAYPNGTGEATFAMDMDTQTGTLTLIFTDSGISYDPLSHEDPDITLSAEEREIGGLGIFMVKKMMDEVSYCRENGKNVLTLKKHINA